MKTYLLLLSLSLFSLPFCMGQKMKKLEIKEETKPRTDTPVTQDRATQYKLWEARPDTTVSILPDGDIKISYPDGSWELHGSNSITTYTASTGQTTKYLFNQVQMAEAPEPLPLGGFSNDF